MCPRVQDEPEAVMEQETGLGLSEAVHEEFYASMGEKMKFAVQRS